MIEPFLGEAASQGVKSFGAVVDKLLGPTAELMGADMAAWYGRRRNVRKVAERAAARADLDAPGAIPSRLAAEVFEKAQWAENEFVAEYLSGVLASGRTAQGENDAAISWTSLVGRLSADQIALHWFIYSGFRRRVHGDDADGYWSLVHKQIVVDYFTLFATLGWELSGEDWDGQFTQRAMAAAYGLKREGLITDLSHGGGDYLQDTVVWTKGRELDRDMGYLTFKPTEDGTALFLHALGLGKQWFGVISSDEAQRADEASESLPKAPASVFVVDLPVQSSPTVG